MAARAEAGGLPREAIVGVLGGGQLGRMAALAAAPMGVKLAFLDPAGDECSAACCAAFVQKGSFRDAEQIAEFAKKVDVLTVEIEHVDCDALEAAAAQADVEVHPSPATIRIIQDKCAQKEYFEAAGVPLPRYRSVASTEELREAAADFGMPLMIKAKRLAYDGRGNAVAKSAAELESAVESLGGFETGLYVEQWAPFVSELAVMVVRGAGGEAASYPVVETRHENSILDTVEAPAAVPHKVARKARKAAEMAIKALPDGARGIYGVELFLMPDGEVLLNEVAPRPHNSGHYTIEACQCSQFENHVRAVLGWPLGSTDMQVGGAVMYNILGEAQDSTEGARIAEATLGAALATPGAATHWYDKGEVRFARKMGHITTVGHTMAEARASLAAVRARREAVLAGGAASDAQTESVHTAAPMVGIIMGSDSDLPTMRAAAEALDELGVGCEVTIVSAHRTPERMFEYARSAAARGLRCIIAGAGGAAHLPGMVAAMTPLPVIGVPCTPSTAAGLSGVDAALSILQMPKGVPVATVAIGNAANAGLLAARIVGAVDPAVREAMERYQDNMERTVLVKAEALNEEGYSDYLEKRGM